MNQEYYEKLPEDEKSNYDALKSARIEAQKRYYLDPQDVELLEMPPRTDSENDLSTHIKLEINNLIWMYASEETTLKDAETMASKWWLELMENREKIKFDRD